MKKFIFVLLLVFIFAFAFTGCKSSESVAGKYVVTTFEIDGQDCLDPNVCDASFLYIGNYIILNADGTYEKGKELDTGETEIDQTGTYTIDGDILTMSDASDVEGLIITVGDGKITFKNKPEIDQRYFVFERV